MSAALTEQDLIEGSAIAAVHYAREAVCWRRRAKELATGTGRPSVMTRRQALAKALAAERRVVNAAVGIEVRLQRLADLADQGASA